jgi:acyl transferase domain-containing protein
MIMQTIYGKTLTCITARVRSLLLDALTCTDNHPGTLKAFLSGRISYAMGLSGPSMTIDTACSSSIVAIHTACRSLVNGDCTAAIAGGVNIMSSPDVSETFWFPDGNP